MQRVDVIAEGSRVMTVCNSCRYCEQYCAVFPAMALHLTFDHADINYLANLCHNCGECLYACQYAPPHEFRIDVPRTFATARVASYEEYCWPRRFGSAFRQHGVGTALALSAAFSLIIGVPTAITNPPALASAARAGEFYAVIPHGAMVSLFGGVTVFLLIAMAVALRRFWRDLDTRPSARAARKGILEALTLRNLHASSRDCTLDEEQRTPWRRWFHHCTFYGFLLCFASTSVAAFYHAVLARQAPYPRLSAPVLLGTAGGIGLLIGSIGLMWERRRRDPALADPDQRGLDQAFILLLSLVSLTGMFLLVLRSTPMMPTLLIVHLGVVLALFVTLPYGKFMHGLYRTAALIKSVAEREDVLPVERRRAKQSVATPAHSL